jgi:hypothetical protein
MRTSFRFASVVARNSLLSLVSLALLAACSGAPDSPGSAPAATATPAPALSPARVTHLLPRGGESTASIHTLPNAVCALSAPGVAEHLTVFSDDDGVARVHLRHLDLAVDGGELTLACTDDAGSQRTHVIDVRVSDTASGQAPEPYLKAGKPTLPALDVDPGSIAREDLLTRGYPPRPDAAQAPAQYAKWLDLVARRARPTIIAPHVVTDPSRVHGPARGGRDTNGNGTSNNWSGYVITTPASATKYAEIFAAWDVPRAYAQSGFASWHHSTLWVGIDGWGTPDVVQAGTDQDSLTAFWVQTSSYDAWTEWYPLSSATISNFPVNPGDEVEVWTWVGTSTGAYSATGNVGWFYLWNVTENVVAAYLSTTAPSGTTFNGHTAEWVMERPEVNGSLSSLADYASAPLFDAWAYDFNGGLHLYTSDSSTQITMTNGSDVLSTVAPVSSEAMQFTWHNYN